MTIQEKALDVHTDGFNCAQSVLAACQELTGLDEKTSKKIAGGLGGGVRCGEVCGALLGAVIALGCAYPYTEDGDLDAANTIAAKTKECTREFREHFGCLRCLELKKAGFSGDETIGYAARLAEQIIKGEEKE